MSLEARACDLRPPVIALVRCSTDQQEHSTADQEAEIRAFAAKRGHPVTRVFRDEGISGSELDRPALREAIAHMERSREKGTLVLWDRNRLARPDDPRDGIALERRIEGTGWNLCYLHGAALTGNVLADTLTGVVDHYQGGEYLRKLSRDTLRGQHRRVLERAVPGGKIPYGYAKEIEDDRGNVTQTVRRTDKHRKHKFERGRLVPGDGHEIAVVKEIFYEYVERRTGFARIARSLNDRKILSPSGGEWTTGTLRDLILNPAYVGDLVWNKETTAKFHRLTDGQATRANTAHTSRTSGKRINYAANDEKDRVVVEGHHEPLVPRELFERAGAIMRSKGRRGGGGRDDYTYPLSGLVFCAGCGSPMTGYSKITDGKKYRTYACSAYFRARACRAFSIPAEKLHAAVLRGLREYYLTEVRACWDGLRERIVNVLRNRLGGTPDGADDFSRLVNERTRLDGQIRKAVENMGLVADPVVARQVAEQIALWNRRRDEITDSIARAEERRSQETNFEAVADEIMGTLSSLDGRIETAPMADQKALLRRALARIELRFVTDVATGTRRKNKHRFVGGTVHATALLEVASRAALEALGVGDQPLLPG